MTTKPGNWITPTVRVRDFGGPNEVWFEGCLLRAPGRSASKVLQHTRAPRPTVWIFDPTWDEGPVMFHHTRADAAREAYASRMAAWKQGSTTLEVDKNNRGWNEEDCLRQDLLLCGMDERRR